ncbi:uncharacterized protein [Magallana gigas]|uniref:uncharacterized protein isoform X2 n=1 Tax=Magallana gigas TaxID=29159 RepID=UPI00333F9651
METELARLFWENKAKEEAVQKYKAMNMDDNVAVIGFGEETKFLHYYSNSYDSIIKCLENIKCKGPSPLEAGIILSFSCIKLGGGHTVISSPLIIRARVVVISDGHPTDMINPRETMATTTQSETFHRIHSLVKRQGKWNPFTFIPVGKDPNYQLLGALAAAAKGGRIIGWEEARLYARLSVNFTVAGDILSHFENKKITEDIVRWRYSNYGEGTEEDINQVCEILNEKEVYGDIDEDEDDENFIERYSTMPCVGTRVRRGRDWRYENQDSKGVGTVIGHTDRVGWILVEWDNGNQFDYRYGSNGIWAKYDLVICDEPRQIPQNETMIATGCLVRRGLDWQWGDQNGDDESIGTVYRVKRRGEVYVRWPNGIKSNYRFGHANKYDLFLWLCIYFIGQNLFGKKIILFLFLSFCFFFFSLIQCIKLYVISINNNFFPFSDPRDPEVMSKYRTQMCKNRKSAKLE